MKIDLSKYPPGTQFKVAQGDTLTLIGKSVAKNDCYILEYNDGTIITRSQNGEHSINSLLSIKSVIQPDKYLVSYLTERDEIGTMVLPIANPKALNEAVLLPIVSRKTSSMMDMIPGCSNCAVKILSWSKIEE